MSSSDRNWVLPLQAAAFVMGVPNC